jgi:hypothetical protein
MELVEAVVRTETEAVGLSLINLSLSAVQDPVAQLTELSDRLPTGVELWLGGPRWRSYRRTSYPRAAYQYGHSRRTRSGCNSKLTAAH